MSDKTRALLLAGAELLGYILLVAVCVALLLVGVAWALEGLHGDFLKAVRDVGEAWRGGRR